jgi:hypothetical protein
MPPKRIMRPTRAGLCSRFILLPLIAVVGCGNFGPAGSFFESWRQWAAGSAAPASGVSNTSAMQASRASPIPNGQSAVEADSAAPPAASKQQAAAEALRASLKAQSAAAAATKASEQALEASKEAAQAAARAGNGSPAAGTSIPLSESAKPAAAEPGGSSSTVILSSASDGTGEQNRAQTEERIRRLDQSIAKIDPTTLDADAAQRKELAERFVQGAQKALLQNDYLEANSLAKKASVMLAPLIGGVPKADSSR